MLLNSGILFVFHVSCSSKLFTVKAHRLYFVGLALSWLPASCHCAISLVALNWWFSRRVGFIQRRVTCFVVRCLFYFYYFRFKVELLATSVLFVFFCLKVSLLFQALAFRVLCSIELCVCLLFFVLSMTFFLVRWRTLCVVLLSLSRRLIPRSLFRSIGPNRRLCMLVCCMLSILLLVQASCCTVVLAFVPFGSAFFVAFFCFLGTPV